jgi:hypothetical protein
VLEPLPSPLLSFVYILSLNSLRKLLHDRYSACSAGEEIET